MVYCEEQIYNTTKKVKNRIKENMEKYCMCLSDAFEEAARELGKEGTELYYAWYYSDFRRFIPCCYEQKYLNFIDYPLKYFAELKTKGV